jgi:hypothetical protein
VGDTSRLNILCPNVLRPNSFPHALMCKLWLHWLLPMVIFLFCFSTLIIWQSFKKSFLLSTFTALVIVTESRVLNIFSVHFHRYLFIESHAVPNLAHTNPFRLALLFSHILGCLSVFWHKMSQSYLILFQTQPGINTKRIEELYLKYELWILDEAVCKYFRNLGINIKM